MDKEKIKELCEAIKENIDWDFDYYSGYQCMMEEINGLVDEIIQEINTK